MRLTNFALMAAVAVAVACGAANGAASGALDTSAFAKHFVITVPAASVPAGGALEDFPVLVRLSTAIAGFDYGDFGQGGDDLVFTDRYGNEMPHEIDTWNTSGESLVWVKVPVLKAGDKIHVFYGSDSLSASTSPADVWTGYVGVWHMGEASGTVVDSTANGFDAVPHGNHTEDMVSRSDGVVGNARINQQSSSYPGYGAHTNMLVVADYDSLGIGSAFTVSGWFRGKSDSGLTEFPEVLVSRKNGDSAGWYFRRIGMDYDANSDRGMYFYGSSDEALHARNGMSLSGMSWMHIVAVYDGAKVSVYRNGESVGSHAIAIVADNGAPLVIGGSLNGTSYSYLGSYDEVRLRGGAMPAEWAKAEYAAVNDRAFLSYGAVSDTAQKIDPSGFAHFVTIVASGSAVERGVELVDFQALVRLSTSIDGFDYSTFSDQEAGSDLVFADADGNVLPHEIDTWNTSGESLVWVRVPGFSNGTVIRAYWGGSARSENAASDTWAGFAGVWHMGESGTTVHDATTNGLDAVAVGSDTSVMTVYDNGAVGKARVNQYEDIGVNNRLEVPSYDRLGLGGRFTLSGWFNVSEANGWHRLFSRKANWGAPGMEVEMNASNANTIDVYDNGGDNLNAVPYPASMNNGWALLTFVYEGSTVRYYANGALVAEASSMTPVVDNGNVLAIGNNASGNERSFFGRYDEVRLCGGSLSAARIAADYATVADAGFFAYGSVMSTTAADPRLAEPDVSQVGEGGVTVSFAMLTGLAVPMLRYVTTGGAVTRQLAEEAVAAPQSFFDEPVPVLAADKTYLPVALGVNASGGEVSQPGSTAFYTGALAVSKASDASEDGLVPGAFTVSRADAAYDLVVNYTLSGSARAGVDYEGNASGTLVIPAGATSATLAVVPRLNASADADTTVVFSFAPGGYPATAATAAMTIANLSTPRRSDFAKMVELTMPMPFLGEGETLVDFPVLVKLSEGIPGFSYSAFRRPCGGDLAFTDASGRDFLAFDVDTWDEAGTSLVWVKVPQLSAGTKIRMYFGNGANAASVSGGAWDGYVGVWHMGEESGAALDASGNGMDAALYGRTADAMVSTSGAVGAGRVCQPSTTYYGNYWAGMKAPSYDAYGLGNRTVFSGWFKCNVGTEWQERLVSREPSGSSTGWGVRREPYTDTQLVVIAGGSSAAVDVPNVRNSWVHLLLAIENKSVTCYVNGESAATFTADHSLCDNGMPLFFGGRPPSGFDWGYSGNFDELRLKGGTVSASWAKAEYLTVASDSFVSFGEVQNAKQGAILLFK